MNNREDEQNEDKGRTLKGSTVRSIIVHRTYSGKTCEYKNTGLHGEQDAEKEVTGVQKETRAGAHGMLHYVFMCGTLGPQIHESCSSE